MHLLFDLDGTLTDSRAGIIRSIRHSLGVHGLAVPEEDELLWCIGPPIHESFMRLAGADGFQAPLETYRERYRTIGIYENAVYPEIISTLEALREGGHTMYVATSKAEIYAKQIITHFELDRFFTRVHGSELDGTRANKGDLIRYILEAQKLRCEEVVMIGDREHDVIGAVSNGVTCIGALWGYGSGRELMESGATLCARVPHLLVELIDTLG